MAYEVLLVEDDPVQALTMQSVMDRLPVSLTLVDNATAAIERVSSRDYDIIVTDIHLPDGDGLDILKAAKQRSTKVIVIIITAHASQENAIEALNLGAYYYYEKPLEATLIQRQIENLLKQLDGERQLGYLNQELSRLQAHDLVGESPAMDSIRRWVSQAATDNFASVLITGESGTGKEVVSRSIHRQSPRSDKPFVAINCTAIPSDLVESELFGAEKGAFTGATQRRIGKLEFAQGGTVFLDEIGDLPIEVQAKLLRVIQDKTFTRLGGNTPIQADIRWICATNADLEQKVKSKEFREDLYYRIAVLKLHLPPLRDRPDDVVPLAEFFLSKHCETRARPVPRFPAEAKRMLREYAFPGNVRELDNVMQRALILSPGDELDVEAIRTLAVGTIGEGPAGPSDGADALLVQPRRGSLKEQLSELEAAIIRKTLIANNFNKSAVARELEIDYKTLRSKIKQYDLSLETMVGAGPE